MNIYEGMSFLGTFALLGLGWLFCPVRLKKRINWRTVAWGSALQIIFAILVLKTPPGRAFFRFMNDVIVKLLSFTTDGARFVFGDLAVAQPPWNFVFAFQVLTTIIFFSSLMSVLYYLGVMQWIVKLFAGVMVRFMGTSGAESLSASANIFVGQTEAPLVIKPYVSEMTLSELHCVMVGGMATVAGGVMAAYVGFLLPYYPDIAGHLLAASVMSAPAALVMAKLLLPETETPKTAGVVKVHVEKTDINIIDAAASGATTGLQLALNVGAMLVAFMALLALFNFLIAKFGMLAGIGDLSLQKIMGWIFYPIAWVMGAPSKDCLIIGQLMGEKTMLNEFVAYLSLANYAQAHPPGTPGALDYRSYVIATYALCGFSNFLSIGIQIGGIGALAPNRKHDLARLGISALIAGSLASFMTATIAGILVR